ncbi:hypothetical protein Btru_038411 [Bulinus truncatus]|nr:hypothetical protein Btru_038411 [Bulinus truncatus]
MEKSKEEVLKRLAELKKELARKQNKLERSRRAANIRAHVKQKVIEFNDKEHTDSLLKESESKNKLLVNQDGYYSSKIDGNKRVDSQFVSSESDSWQEIKAMTKVTLSHSELEKFEVKAKAIMRNNFHDMNNVKNNDVPHSNEFQNNYSQAYYFTSSDLRPETKADTNFLESTLLKLNKKSPEYQINLTNVHDLNYVQQENRVYSDATNTSTDLLSSIRNIKDASDLDKMICNNNISPNVSSMTKKHKQLDKNNFQKTSFMKSVNEINSMSDTQFLNILGVTVGPKDSLESLNTNTESHSTLLQTNTLPVQKESSQHSVSLSLNHEVFSNMMHKQQSSFKNVYLSSNVLTHATQDRDKLCDLDFTELDVIPYTKFELGEDFLSETSPSTKSNIHFRHSLKVEALVKRRSPRISEHKHLPLTLLQNNEKMSSGESKRKFSQEHVVAIMSIFQFLKEEASKPKWVSDFELPDLFDDLKGKKNFQPKFYQNSSRNVKKLTSSEKVTPHDRNDDLIYFDNEDNSRKTKKHYKQHNTNGAEKDTLSSQTALILQKSPDLLCFVNETVSGRVDFIRSLPSPIAHEVIEEDYMVPEVPVKEFSLQGLNENKSVANQELTALKNPTPLVNTSTPKVVKSKFNIMTLSDTLDKSDILFEEDDQQKKLQEATIYQQARELGDNDSSRTSESNHPEYYLNTTNFDCLNPIANNFSNLKEALKELNISHGQASIHSSCMSFDSYSHGTSPMKLIRPWKKLKRTLMTPVQVMEDKRNENQLSPVVFLPARRLSRCNLIEGKTKTLKYCGCFQSCSQDAVIKIVCGSLITKNEEIKEYLVSVQATSLAVWAKDDDLRWVTELDWRLSSETHLIEAQLLPVSDKISIIACGWDGGFLFVSLFIYDSDTEDTKRFNIETSELLNGLSSPSNALLTVVSVAEILLGITTDALHMVGKIDFFDDFTNKKICFFHKQRGHLLDIVTVTNQSSACISLTSDQNITIWNTNYGILIKTIQLPVYIPYLTKLLNARSYQGTVLLETMWRVDRGCGGVIVVNPLTGSMKLLKAYDIPNSTWKCTQSAQLQMGFISAVNDRGSFCIWDRHNGSLVCYSKSHRATALCIMDFDQSLFVGEIQGCLHLYKLNSETV